MKGKAVQSWMEVDQSWEESRGSPHAHWEPVSGDRMRRAGQESGRSKDPTSHLLSECSSSGRPPRGALTREPGSPAPAMAHACLEGERKKKKNTFREVIGATPPCQQITQPRASNRAESPLKGTVDPWPCCPLCDGSRVSRLSASQPGACVDVLHKGATLQPKNQNSSHFRNKTYASAGGLTSLPLHSQHEAWALYNSSKRPHIMSSALTL